MPNAAAVLRQTLVCGPMNLFGDMTKDIFRANTFVSQKKNLKLIDVNVPLEDMLKSLLYCCC